MEGGGISRCFMYFIISNHLHFITNKYCVLLCWCKKDYHTHCVSLSQRKYDFVQTDKLLCQLSGTLKMCHQNSAIWKKRQHLRFTFVDQMMDDCLKNNYFCRGRNCYLNLGRPLGTFLFPISALEIHLNFPKKFPCPWRNIFPCKNCKPSNLKLQACFLDQFIFSFCFQRYQICKKQGL